MALINRIFPNTLSFRSSQSTTSKSDSCLAAGKRLSKQQDTIAQAIKNQLNSRRISCNLEGDSAGNVQPQFHGVAAKTRLLLFRECEVKGRRLLFDSAAGQVKDDTGLQQDIQLMKDMVFGSATLKYFGDNYRVHDFGTVPWRGYHMMLTKVFLVPPPTAVSKARSNVATCRGLVEKVHSSTPGADSGFVDNGTNSGSGLSSISSSATGASLSSSGASFSCTSLAIPRIGSSRKAVSDSILGHELSELDKLSRSRKVRLAIALLFPPDDGVDESDQTTPVPIRQVIFEQFGLMEHFVQRLHFAVLRAYSSRQHFMTLIHEAIAQFGRDVDNLTAAYNRTPVYLKLTPASGDSGRLSSCDQVADEFMTQWESIVSETDTKLTRFFWSTLLSAVLTYHVNWLHSYVSHKSEFFDCGTRILVLSKNKSLAERILYLLSYFVRHASVSSAPIHHKSSSADTANRDLPQGHSQSNGNNGKLSRNLNEPVNDESTMTLSSSMGHFSVPIESSPSASYLKFGSCRRGSQQSENARYLRNYYDVRFQLSPDTLTKRDGRTTFANVKYSIAKNGFQDFSLREGCNISSPPTDQQQEAPNGSSQSTGGNDAPAFFVGSFPDRSFYQGSEAPRQSADSPSDAMPIQVTIPSASALKRKRLQHSHLSRWVYGNTLNSQYQAGRILQSCDPSLCDWLHELQRDLRAAVPQIKTVSCIVANTETWEVQVLTCVEEEKYPLRIKEFWVPVAMSGQVAALVESTQLLWLLQHNPQQCLEHIEERLRFLCHKSEDVGALLSGSIRSWNVDHVNRLLGTETQDLPLLMAGCSVHSPFVAQMGGVTIL